MATLDETDVKLRVKSSVIELDVDDSDCCYNCMTLLIRLIMQRTRVSEVRSSIHQPERNQDGRKEVTCCHVGEADIQHHHVGFAFSRK